VVSTVGPAPVLVVVAAAAVVVVVVADVVVGDGVVSATATGAGSTGLLGAASDVAGASVFAVAAAGLPVEPAKTVCWFW
jgi:hypothetical protein